MSGMTDQTLASFKVNPELWQRFQARCVEKGTTAAEVLKNLIADYLKQTNDSFSQTSSISPDLSLDDLIEGLIQEKVANYLDQYLDSRIVSFLEDYLQDTSQDSLEEPDSSSTEVKKSDFEPSVPQKKTHEILLKTAKELSKILGVSAPYITTLNRIGELQQWGWQDSGKRHGKTILYQPIDEKIQAKG